MKEISWFWAAICSLLAIFIIVGWLQFGKLTPSASILTELEAQNLVQNRYQGNVSDIKLTKRQYHIELTKQSSLYVIKLDAESGKVLSLVQKGLITQKPSEVSKVELTEDEIKKIVLAVTNGLITSVEKIENNFRVMVREAGIQTTITVDGVSGAILTSTSTPLNEPPKQLTDAEAIQIALKQFQGEVDDIWLETQNDQSFYLVEIETPEEREATVQIHAITGGIMSVTWDDSDNNGEDEDD